MSDAKKPKITLHFTGATATNLETGEVVHSGPVVEKGLRLVTEAIESAGGEVTDDEENE